MNILWYDNALSIQTTKQQSKKKQGYAMLVDLKAESLKSMSLERIDKDKTIIVSPYTLIDLSYQNSCYCIFGKDNALYDGKGYMVHKGKHTKDIHNIIKSLESAKDWK